jgi:acyl carrier protein
MEFEKIRDIIVEVLNVEPDQVSEDSKFIDDLGCDSLDVMQIIMGMEQEFGIKISDEDAKGIVTVGDAVEKIQAAIN